MLIPDALYAHRKGATDSEVLFLLMLGRIEAGMAPVSALVAAMEDLSALSCAHGEAPHMRLSAGFSDGETLWAARFSSDAIAPTLYYRWSEARAGWAVVSEPLESGEGDWIELAPGQAAVFRGAEVEVLAL